jgi:hypothetical protein
MRCPFRFRGFPEGSFKSMSDAAWIQMPTICAAWEIACIMPKIPDLPMRPASPEFVYCSLDANGARRDAPELCKRNPSPFSALLP